MGGRSGILPKLWGEVFVRSIPLLNGNIAFNADTVVYCSSYGGDAAATIEEADEALAEC